MGDKLNSLRAPNSAIVFGASGNIGRALMKHLKLLSWQTMGTYATRPSPGLSLFDVEKNASLTSDMERFEIGIICSSLCNIEACKQKFEQSRRINIAGTKRLLESLLENGKKAVYFSSDYVYDGQVGNYTERDLPCSNTEYGRQKAKMETYIAKHFPETLVVRLSKVISADPTDSSLLSDWYRKMERGQAIKTAVDQRMSPTYIEDVVRGLVMLIEKNATGLYNLCQPKSYSRGELLSEFLSYLKREYPYIEECKTEAFGFLENRPKDTSLCPEKFITFTGYSFTKMEEVFSAFMKNM
jgi:dTDP-4-dehydrorhamnose reductase